jgi:hypothetical protein
MRPFFFRSMSTSPFRIRLNNVHPRVAILCESKVGGRLEPEESFRAISRIQIDRPTRKSRKRAILGWTLNTLDRCTDAIPRTISLPPGRTRAPSERQTPATNNPPIFDENPVDKLTLGGNRSRPPDCGKRNNWPEARYVDTETKFRARIDSHCWHASWKVPLNSPFPDGPMARGPP